MDWIDLCAETDVPASGGCYVIHNGVALAIMRDADGSVCVLDDACPHAGGSLSAGRVVDGCAVCPWHGWAFALADGKCPDNPALAVRRHESRVVDGVVQVRAGASGSGA